MITREINFKKSRDFGDLLSDTFGFLKQEFKFLMKVLLIYAGPFALITAIAAAWMQKGVFSMMGMMVSQKPMEVLAEFGLKFLIYMSSALVSTTVLFCVIYSYINLYVDKGKDGFTPEDVWRHVGKKFFRTLWAMIVVSILFTIGFMLCFVPGIYLIVSFCLVMSVVFFEDQPLGSAMERSISLVKSDWWITFAIIIILYILMTVISYIFMIPGTIASFFISINTLKGGGSEDASLIYMILIALGTFLASFVAAVPHITFALHYYSQIEKKESPGLFNRIEQINNPINEDKPLF
jgi:hypothetical protein